MPVTETECLGHVVEKFCAGQAVDFADLTGAVRNP
jgi:hypothetical protein